MQSNDGDDAGTQLALTEHNMVYVHGQSDATPHHPKPRCSGRITRPVSIDTDEITYIITKIIGQGYYYI